MVDATELSTSSGTPSTIERSPLDFSNEDAPPPVTQGAKAGVHGPRTICFANWQPIDAWGGGTICSSVRTGEALAGACSALAIDSPQSMTRLLVKEL
ncbi:hypothetical protein Tco_0173583 [Tanacetum coccineum]